MIVTNTLPGTTRYAHFAMATEFELFVADEASGHGRAAAAEVFREVDRLEGELSRFREGSDIYRLNHAPRGARLSISPDTFACLQGALELGNWTRGAFDVAYASRRPPGGQAKDLLSLDERGLCATVHAEAVALDLGGIGKGYALDRAADLLAEWDLSRCLIHGGGSSLRALGPPPGQAGWPVGVGEQTIVPLAHGALSASGTEVRGQHILDPRREGTSRRDTQTRRTWVTAPGAAEADALSTAFMVLSPEEVEACCAAHPGIGAVLETETGDTLQIGRKIGREEDRKIGCRRPIQGTFSSSIAVKG
jgi:thiamine biosynthesis lipoprotein